jgi:hypothetical protein
MKHRTRPPRVPIDVRKYVGRWVALDPRTSKVVADGASVTEARRQAILCGTVRPLLMMVPKSDGYFVGTIWTGFDVQ